MIPALSRTGDAPVGWKGPGRRRTRDAEDQRLLRTAPKYLKNWCGVPGAFAARAIAAAVKGAS